MLLLCAGCGGSASEGGTTGSTTPTTTATTGRRQSALGTLLPPAIQDAGVLRVATGHGMSPLDRQLARATAAAFGTALKLVSSDPVAAVATSRADLGWASLPDTAANRRSVVYVDYLMGGNGGPIGIAIKKGNGQLVTALQAALQHLYEDGTYGRILARNHATYLSVSYFGTNGR